MKVFDDISVTNRPTLETYGTKVSLKMEKVQGLLEYVENVKSNHPIIKYSQYAAIIEYLEDLGRFSSVKTDLIIKGGEMFEIPDSTKFLGPVNIKDMIPIDIREPFIDNEQFIMSTDDFDLIGISFASKKYALTKLVGMPIRNDDFILDDIFGAYFINIKNERKYKPTASRDMIKKEYAEKLQENVQKEMINYVREQNIDNLDDWINFPHKVMLNQLQDRCTNKGHVDECLVMSKKFFDLFNTMCHYYYAYGQAMAVNSLTMLLKKYASENKAWAEKHDERIRKFNGLVIIPSPELADLLKNSKIIPHISTVVLNKEENANVSKNAIGFS